MQNDNDTVQFVKDKLKHALGELNHTAFDHEHLDDTMKRFMEVWVTPSPEHQEAYKLAMFDSFGFVHYTPKDGGSHPRYGWQAVLNGPLFESRKEFRSLRSARLWVKEQMRCKCWPAATNSEQVVDERVINMSVTFDYEGLLDTTKLVQRNA